MQEKLLMQRKWLGVGNCIRLSYFLPHSITLTELLFNFAFLKRSPSERASFLDFTLQKKLTF